MPTLESRFTTVAVCLDALRLGEPAKLNMTTTTATVPVFAIVATFSRWRVLASSDEPRPQRVQHSRCKNTPQPGLQPTFARRV